MSDDAVPFNEMTDDQAIAWARLIERAVHSDPARFLHQSITPFATAADLMGGPPPRRWRFWARARWRDRLFQRSYQELIRQRAFAKRIMRLIEDTTPRPSR